VNDATSAGPTAPGFEQITTTAAAASYSSATKVLHTAAKRFPDRSPIRQVQIPPAPHTVEQYLTMYCQAQCAHCNAWQRNRALGETEMPPEMAWRLHRSLKRMGVRGVQYCGGGEPTVWRGGRVADLIADLDAGTMRAGMASNLIRGHVLARPEVLANMQFIEAAVFAYDDAGYRLVAGGKRFHTALERSVRRILQVRNEAGLTRPRVNAKIIINNVNYGWLRQIYSWAAGIGFDNIHLRLADDYEGRGGFVLDPEERVRFRADLERLVDDHGLGSWAAQIDHIMGEGAKGAAGEHHWCWTVAAGLNCWVLADGGVYVCGPQWGRKEYLIGNLNGGDLEDIWGSEQHYEVARRLIANMGLSRCYELGCRHIHQGRAIDAWAAGDLQAPPAEAFAEQDAWFL
jgi:MoaA/NifB/PqqE/SkfB family radical SAM enzyme